jgi:multisubunit Na+/H+ antiporter MnhE subunit
LAIGRRRQVERQMIKRILTIVVLVPVAIVLIALAVANRTFVPFTLNPFDPGDPGLTLSLPFFVYLFIALRDLAAPGPLPQDGPQARRGSAHPAR